MSSRPPLPPSSSQPPSSNGPLPLLRVRLSNVSASMVPPLLDLDQMSSSFSPELSRGHKKTFYKVPIIKVYGVTEGGQRACVNVHGAYPYIYINYPKDLSLSPETVSRFINKLGAELNLALAKAPAEGRPPGVGNDFNQNRPSSINANAIQSIRLVKGTPFYGYHVGFSYYLRIAFLKHSHRWTLLKVLGEEGLIRRRKFEVYEAHLGFVLQFLCDFGLGGCGWLDIQDARFREPLPRPLPSPDPRSQLRLPSHLRKWTSANIPPHLLHPTPSRPARTSRSSIEIDIDVSSILNRLQISTRRLHDDFIELRSGLRSDKKLIDSLEELWEDERRRRREAGKMDDVGLGKLSYGEREGKADEVPGKGVGWNSEPRWWEDVRKRIEQDTRNGKGGLSFEGFLKAGEREMTDEQREQMDLFIPTTLEALIKGWRETPLPSRAPPPDPFLSQLFLYPSTPFASQRPSASPSEAAYNASSDDASSTTNLRIDEGKVAAAAARAVVEERERDRGDDDDDWERREEKRIRQLLKIAEEEEPAAPWAGDGGFEENKEIRMSQSQGAKGRGTQRWDPFEEETPSKPPVRRSTSTTRTPPPLTAAPSYPHADLYNPSSTREERKSRSPNSPARPKHLFPSPDKSNAPTTPSRLREVEMAMNESDSSLEDVYSNAESDEEIKLGDGSPKERKTGGKIAQAGRRPESRDSRTGEAIGEGSSRSSQPVYKPLSRLNPYSFAFSTSSSITPLPKSNRIPSLEDPVNGNNKRPRLRPLARSPSPSFIPSSEDVVASSDPALEPTLLAPTQIGTASQMLIDSQAGNFTPTLRSSFASSRLPSSVSASRPSKRVRIEEAAFDEDEEEEEEITSAQPRDVSKSSRLSPVDDQEDQEVENENGIDIAVDPDSLASTETLQSSGSDSGSLANPVSSSQQQPTPFSSLPLVHNPLSGPPSTAFLLQALANETKKQPRVDIEYQDPFFSDPKDVPTKAREFGGQKWILGGKKEKKEEEKIVEEFRFESRFCEGLEEIGVGGGRGRRRRADGDDGRRVLGWEIGERAPSRGEVEIWVEQEVEPEENRRKKVYASQIEGPTQKNTQGFKFSQISEASISREKRFMSVLSLEIIAISKNGLLPYHKEDEILGAFYCFQSDGEFPDNCKIPGCHVGMILLSSLDAFALASKYPPHGIVPEGADNELDLIHCIVDLVRRFDPDILSGWEVQSTSWGYVSRRMQVYGQSLASELSPATSLDANDGPSQYNSDHSTDFQVEGRHIFNLWRLLRGDLNLNQYTIENVAFHLLHRRIPKYNPQTLHAYIHSEVPSQQIRALDHLLSRAIMVIEMLDVAELVSKNAEFARVYGVDFSDVYMRGSQFKVESFMFRLAKPESLLLQTPSKDEVGGQDGAECIPLIMEPQSSFYKDPVVVLDFQSLYPSIMIAYNICYSTCLGRADRLVDKEGNPTDRFGFSKHELIPGTLELLEEYITISPNGMMYVKPNVRKSLLAKMLGELLDTRVMVKTAMKGYRDDKGLTRVLNARQLALKLLANVTYGYTSASFSGRMPHIQVADSIVQYGRESLEKAIEFIESNPQWRAKVVYGDTDSLFIYMPGRSKDEAFLLGNEIADAVTARNPKPMKLKFEKVYLPCVLQSKKRYVGFKYENPDDLEPVLEAKGIETIRRDGIPAQQKELEECIKILFRTQDLSLVKSYLYRQWTRIIQGKISIQDFTFAKEVRLGTYSVKSRPPHVIVAAIRAEMDPSDEPQYGERVPYIIAEGAPGEPQYKRARQPEDFLADRHLRLDHQYYIKNILIPPLSRVFNLLGADVSQWYHSMPKKKWIAPAPFGFLSPKQKELDRKNSKRTQSNLTEFYESSMCFLCGTSTQLVPAVCKSCRCNPSLMAYNLLEKVQAAQARLVSAQLVCSSCTSTPAAEPVRCESLDCSILYARVGASRQVGDLQGVGEFVTNLGDEGGGPVVIDGLDW